jgi:asparagine synthase (glutamine-hydrolysing)
LSDSLNEQAIGDYLLFGLNDDSGTTSFADIRRLPPAHRLMVVDDQVQVKRYWAPPASAIIYRSPQDTVAEFGALFEQAVADRLRAERVALQLSGGMDSASVALTAGRLRDRDGVRPAELRAHTLVFRQGAPDEEDHYAGLVAETARLPREVVAIEQEPSEAETAAALHVPPEPGLPAGGPSEKLSERMAQFSRVALAGYGGDPLLYPSQTYLPELVKTFHWGRLIQGLFQSWRMQGDLPPLYARTWLKRRLGQRPHRLLPTWLRRSFAKRLGLAQRWQRRFEPAGAVDHRLGMANDSYWPGNCSGM